MPTRHRITNLPIVSSSGTVRYAVPEDWQKVCALERTIFPGVNELFTPGALERCVGRFSRGLIVAVWRDALIGYAALFPLTADGEAVVSEGDIHTVCDLGIQHLSESIDENSPAIFIEVVAFREDAPIRVRKMVWQHVLHTLRHYKGRIYVCPVSQKGEEIVRSRGFVPVKPADSTGGAVYRRVGYWH